jgi:hypothetical protein
MPNYNHLREPFQTLTEVIHAEQIERPQSD